MPKFVIDDHCKTAADVREQARHVLALRRSRRCDPPSVHLPLTGLALAASILALKKKTRRMELALRIMERHRNAMRGLALA